MTSRAAARVLTPLSILFLLAIPYHVAAQTPSPNESRDPYGNYTRVTPSMALIIVILISVLFLMGFFSIYIRHCADATGGPSARGVVPGGRSRRLAVARGLNAETIETFPTLVYSVVKGMKIGKGALECAVCLSEFEDDETLRLIPKCDHVFHPECIDEWLSSHTTCPVCRADLTLEAGESVPQLSDLHPELSDIENQNGAFEVRRGEGTASNDDERNVDMLAPEPEVMGMNRTLNRNRTGGSTTRRFPRSHSTGHSLVQPGENTERFTLRLPVEVRKKIMDQQLNRTLSMVGLPREGSSKRGYRAAGGEGGKSFNYRRLERLDQQAKSERWIFNRTPSFLTRASTLLTRVSSIKSPKVAAKESADGSNRSSGPNMAEPSLPPV